MDVATLQFMATLSGGAFAFGGAWVAMRYELKALKKDISELKNRVLLLEAKA